MYVLWEQGELSITDIARLTSLANTTLTGMLDRMEAQGLVVRIPDQRNRRRILIQLTPKARRLQDAYDEVSEKNNAIFYAGFTQSEIQQFEAMLNGFCKTMRRKANHE